MTAVGVWQVDKERVARVEPANLSLERELEEWIEREPSLLESGLEIVGRQVHVEGGIIDLLALDVQGRWVVIEIKKGSLYRDTVVQALDYASCIAKMDLQELQGKVNDYLKSVGRGNNKSEGALSDRIDGERADGKDREVAVYVVGTGQDPSLERVLDYLGGKSQRVFNAVLFNVFEFGSGHRFLVRELTPGGGTLEAQTKKTEETGEDPVDVKKLVEIAKRNGLGEAFECLLGAADRHGFYPRPYKHSIMFAPPSNRARCLFVAWVKPKADHLLKLYVVPDAFQEFYALEQGLAMKELGNAGERQMTVSQVEEFGRSLDRLMSSVEQESTNNS